MFDFGKFFREKIFKLDQEIHHKEKKVTLSNGKVIEVDKKMTEIVKALNDKGYTTVFSCQGEKKHGQALYIAFDKQYLKIIENYPRDIFYHFSVNDPVGKPYMRLCLYAKQNPSKELYKDIFNWIKTLPDNKEFT